MKKLIMSALAVVVVAASASIGYISYTQHQNRLLAYANPLMEENINALADDDTPSLPYECYDTYKAYSNTGALKRFRPCDTPKCDHIWAYSPKKRTVCPNSK